MVTLTAVGEKLIPNVAVTSGEKLMPSVALTAAEKLIPNVAVTAGVVVTPIAVGCLTQQQTNKLILRHIPADRVQSRCYPG